MKLTGKAAVITGGGTGVGRAAAILLAQQGCSSIINFSRSREEAENTVAEVKSFGVDACAVQANVANDEDCRRLMDAAAKQLGGIDILINSAGTTRFIPMANLDDVTEEAWRETMGVNVQGAFQCMRAAAPYLQQRGAGEIVNISSIAAITAAGSSIPYSASKAALNCVTVSMAKALAPIIRVNAVAPGFITGRWLEKGLGDQYETVKNAFAAGNPLGRVCDPSDVAECVLSLIRGSDLVTGQILAVDAGTLIADRGQTVARAGSPNLEKKTDG